MKTYKTLSEIYSHPGFRARSKLTGIFGDPYARVISLVRRQKKPFVRCVTRYQKPIMIRIPDEQETCHVVHIGSISNLNIAVYFAKSVMP